MMSAPELTVDRLRELLFYDPDTGTFTCLKPLRTGRGSRTDLIGKTVGTRRPDGYRVICIRPKHYYAHRLAFFYMTGRWPVEIDHINRDPSDNRWLNLREVSSAGNKHNQGLMRRNKSGFRGVHQSCRGRWVAQIRLNGKHIHLGTFNSAKAAAEIYERAARTRSEAI